MLLTSPLGESCLAETFPGSYVRGTHSFGEAEPVGGAQSGTERR